MPDKELRQRLPLIDFGTMGILCHHPGPLHYIDYIDSYENTAFRNNVFFYSISVLLADISTSMPICASVRKKYCWISALINRDVKLILRQFSKEQTHTCIESVAEQTSNERMQSVSKGTLIIPMLDKTAVTLLRDSRYAVRITMFLTGSGTIRAKTLCSNAEKRFKSEDNRFGSNPSFSCFPISFMISSNVPLAAEKSYSTCTKPKKFRAVNDNRLSSGTNRHISTNGLNKASA